jgi:superoxide dismutase, Fe-Mn family
MATGPVHPQRATRWSILLTMSAIAALFLVQCGFGSAPAEFVKEPLPYALDALAPHISAEAMDLHYNKHYAGYVKKAIALTRGTAFSGESPDAVIRLSAGDEASAAIFNNAAQAWNHAFYFKCLAPDGGGAPEGQLAAMIDEAFGSLEAFKKEFIAAAGGQFGSGWAWLVLADGHLNLFVGGNADTPIAHDLVPLLAVDVWEHAYYLDYQNRRAEFVATVLDKLVNWPFVAEQLEKALPPEA